MFLKNSFNSLQFYIFINYFFKVSHYKLIYLQTRRISVLGKYPAEKLRVVTNIHTPAEVMELTLYPGDIVAIIKEHDPLGRSDRWFVDDGGKLIIILI